MSDSTADPFGYRPCEMTGCPLPRPHYTDAHKTRPDALCGLTTPTGAAPCGKKFGHRGQHDPAPDASGERCRCRVVYAGAVDAIQHDPPDLHARLANAEAVAYEAAGQLNERAVEREELKARLAAAQAENERLREVADLVIETWTNRDFAPSGMHGVILRLRAVLAEKP